MRHKRPPYRAQYANEYIHIHVFPEIVKLSQGSVKAINIFKVASPRQRVHSEARE